MIFRNHPNMLIYCSRNISDYYQCWTQLCCFVLFFLWKLWSVLFFSILWWIASSKDHNWLEIYIFITWYMSLLISLMHPWWIITLIVILQTFNCTQGMWESQTWTKFPCNFISPVTDVSRQWVINIHFTLDEHGIVTKLQSQFVQCNQS